jgi:multiple sugar transport system permease protein
MSSVRTPQRSAGAQRPAASRVTHQEWSRHRIQTVMFRWLRRLTILVLILVTGLPFYYMALLSVRSIQQVLLEPGSIWVSIGEMSFTAYRQVLRSTDDGGQGFLQFITNSLIVAGVTVVATLLFSIPGAYAVSRLVFKGRRQISALFLVVYLFPPMILAIPLYVIFTRVGLSDSLWGLAIVYVAQTIPVAIYMLRGYFATIPRSLEEAALLDGCSRLQILTRISLPLALPSVMATGLYVFMIAWNEFLFALLFLVADPDKWTVSLGLSQLSGSIEVPTTVLMAGSVVLTVPIIVLFFATERLLVEGLTAGAEKG